LDGERRRKVYSGARKEMTGADLELILGRLGVSKPDLATIVGVTPRQVYSWLNGSHKIPRSVSIILAALDNKKINLEWVVDFVEMEMRREADHV
jgi:hypothetical protein